MRLSIRLTPRSSHNKIIAQADGTFKAQVTSPPVDGAANQALLRLVSDYFDIPISQIAIIRGKNSRIKTVEIPDRG
jgi:uncharacterized protein (TIGR00251 family)